MTKYFGFDESGSKPTFIVVAWSDDPDSVKLDIYGKKRRKTILINPLDKYKFTFVPELKTDMTEKRVKEIASLSYESGLTSEDFLYVDAFRDPTLLTDMLLEELSKYNINLDRFKLQAGHKFDQRYKIVNDADRIAIELLRSYGKDELYKYAEHLVHLKIR